MAHAARCPICARPTDVTYRPFCSKRCADVDLARWLQGSYVVAGGSSDSDEDGDDTAAGHQPAAEQPRGKPHEDG